MKRTRNLISVNGDIYAEAKNVFDELSKIGRSVTMEDAVYIVKKRKDASFKESSVVLERWKL
jgi:hypothetical protein